MDMTKGGDNGKLFDEVYAEYVSARRENIGTKLYCDHLHESIMEQLGDALYGDVLELMSGHGDLGSKVESRARRLVAVDISENMLRHNRCRNRILADAADLPFDNATFDAVVVSAGLHHLNDANVGIALSEIGRVLRSGGKLAFYEPSDDFVVAKWLREYFHARLDCLGDREHDELILTRPSIRRFLGKAGFSDVRLRPFGQVAYGLLSQVDAATFLVPIARMKRLSKALIALDKLADIIPLVRFMAFGTLGVATK